MIQLDRHTANVQPESDNAWCWQLPTLNALGLVGAGNVPELSGRPASQFAQIAERPPAQDHDAA